MTKTAGKMIHPLVSCSKIVGDLAYQCRQAGYSLRLLAALMDTKSYGVVYQSMISAQKGRGGRRGPTPQDRRRSLEESAHHLLVAMKTRGITPRRWCTAYNIELSFLCIPSSNLPDSVLAWLQEDFPEAFGLTLPPYAHAYEPVQGFQHLKVTKSNIHLYKLRDGSVTASRSSGKALSIACRLQGLTIQAERLRVLLQDGPAAALAWVPKKELLISEKLTAEEKILSEKMGRESAVRDMIDELASIRKLYPTPEQTKRRNELYLLLQKEGWTTEMINAEVSDVRWKAGKY